MADNNSSKRAKFSKESAKKAKRVFKYLKPYRWTFRLGLLFLLFSSITSMIFPELMSRLINAGSLPRSASYDLFEMKSINSIVTVLMIVFAFQAIFSFFRIYIFNYVTENILKKIRSATFENVIKLPMSFFSSRQVGELNSRISTDITLLQDTFTTTLAEFIRQFITIAIGIIVISMISWKLVVVILATLPAIILFAVLFGKFIKKLSNQSQEAVAESNVIVQEAYTGINSVKSFSNEWFEIIRYGKSTSKIKSIAMWCYPSEQRRNHSARTHFFYHVYHLCWCFFW